MTHQDFVIKLRRWLDYAKTQRVRRYDAWPFWFQFLSMFNIDVKPPLFWRLWSLFGYYLSVFFFSFCFLAQYFTRHFFLINGQIHWENMGITLLMSIPLSYLMTYNMRLKQRRLNLPEWENF